MHSLSFFTLCVNRIFYSACKINQHWNVFKLSSSEVHFCPLAFNEDVDVLVELPFTHAHVCKHTHI
jgi:hypothetical protein